MGIRIFVIGYSSCGKTPFTEALIEAFSKKGDTARRVYAAKWLALLAGEDPDKPVWKTSPARHQEVMASMQASFFAGKYKLPSSVMQNDVDENEADKVQFSIIDGIRNPFDLCFLYQKGDAIVFLNKEEGRGSLPTHSFDELGVRALRLIANFVETEFAGEVIPVHYHSRFTETEVTAVVERIYAARVNALQQYALLGKPVSEVDDENNLELLRVLSKSGKYSRVELVKGPGAFPDCIWYVDRFFP